MIFYAFSVYCVSDEVLLGKLFSLQNKPMRKIYFTFYRLRHREFKYIFIPKEDYRVVVLKVCTPGPQHGHSWEFIRNANL